MEIDNVKITENYGERMKRLGLFSFLFGLQAKTQKDSDGNRIDFFALGFLTLLFFFENMLMRYNKVSVKDLSEFLRKKTGTQYNLSEDDYLKIAETIISTFRPTSGERPKFSYFDWEHSSAENLEYRILKRGSADLEKNTQYYMLDEDGLALIFATKEYFNEFQISINQLLLRQQLQKGEFINALRQIDEMYVEVLTLKERILKIKQEIQRSIVSDETYNRYKTIADDISTRLKRENQEFSEIMEYVKQLQNHFGTNTELLNEKDRQSYYLIMKIDVELDTVHFEHKKLLDESFLLEKSALQAARESIYFSGSYAFNFNREIGNMIFSLPVPVEEIRTICEPFLSLRKTRSFNILNIFAEQRISIEQKENITTFVEPTDEEEYIDYLKISSMKYEDYMTLVLNYMEGKNTIELGEIIEKAEKYNPEILEERSFFDMFIVLHQKSPFLIDYSKDDKMTILFSGINRVLYKYQSINLTEKSNILKIKDFHIQNMIITLNIKERG